MKDQRGMDIKPFGKKLQFTQAEFHNSRHDFFSDI
jgi:hypothetical protein